MVILLQGFLKVEDAQVVLAHSKVNTAQIIPEHAAHTFTYTKGEMFDRKSSHLYKKKIFLALLMKRREH